MIHHGEVEKEAVEKAGDVKTECVVADTVAETVVGIVAEAVVVIVVERSDEVDRAAFASDVMTFGYGFP